MWTFAAFHRVSLHAQEAVLLEWCHLSTHRAQIATPEARHLVSTEKEPQQNEQLGIDQDRN